MDVILFSEAAHDPGTIQQRKGLKGEKKLDPNNIIPN